MNFLIQKVILPMYNFLEKNLGSQPILHSFSQLSDIADSKLWEKKIVDSCKSDRQLIITCHIG